MISKILLISILSGFVSFYYIYTYEVVSDYIKICNFGVTIFNKPNTDVLINAINKKCNQVKMDRFNIDNDMENNYVRQFNHNTNITGRWINVNWNSTHNVCTVNLGNHGVDIVSFIDIVENKCNVSSNNHITYNHTEF